MVLLIHAGLGVVDIMGVPQTTMITAHLALTAVALLALPGSPSSWRCCTGTRPDRGRTSRCSACTANTWCQTWRSVLRVGWRHGRRHAPRATIAVRRVPCAEWTPRRVRDRDRPETDRAGGIHGARRELSRLRSPAWLLPGTRNKRPRYGRLLGCGARESSSGLGFWSVCRSGLRKNRPTTCAPQLRSPGHRHPGDGATRYTSPTGKFSVSYPTPDSAYEVTKTTTESRRSSPRATPASCSCSPQPATDEPRKSAKASSSTSSRMPRPPTKYPTRRSATKPDTARSPIPGRGWQRKPSGFGPCCWSPVKNDLALIAGAVGPLPRIQTRFRARVAVGSQPSNRAGHGKYVNSFSWQGDPAR